MYNKINQIQKSQRGISLFDFVLWFAIAGAFLAAIYAIFAPSRTATRANNVFIELQTAQSSIRTAYSGNPNFYTGMNLESLSKAHNLPSSIKSSSGSDGFSTEGGGISIAADAANSTFTITYKSLPSTTFNLLLNKLNMDDWVTVGGGDATGSKDCKAKISNCIVADPSTTPNVMLKLQSS